MASAYPGSLDTFATNKANATATTTDHPNHHNDLADAVNKIEAELGVNSRRARMYNVAPLAAAYASSDTADALRPGTASALNGQITDPASFCAMPSVTFESYISTRNVVGWEDDDLAGTQLWLRLDFGAAFKGLVVAGELAGVADTVSLVYHPATVALQYSDDSSAWTTFGVALSGVSKSLVTLGSWAYAVQAEGQLHRYWRFLLDEPSPKTNDNWIILIGGSFKLWGAVIPN